MKTKIIKILVVIFVVATLASVLCGCTSQEQSLEGMYIVTFKFNEGTLYNGSTNIKNEIHHAYEPNSKIIDIAHHEPYEFTRNDYDFVGWYTDSECTKQWNFQTDTITVEKLTLYAKWKPKIKYTYELYYTDQDGTEKKLGAYQVDEGRKFSDSNNFAANGLTAENKTFVNFYSDKELTTLWDANFTHPGGEQDTAIPVYVDWIDGVWKLVSDFDGLYSAFDEMTDGVEGIWLTADIDCGGAEFYVDSFDKTLRGDNDGGANYKISNFVIEGQVVKSNYPRYSIFGTLGANANIYDVDFDNVMFEFSENTSTRADPQIAALAQTVETSEDATCTISNVNISGTYENKNLTCTKLKEYMETMSDILANLVYRQDAAITTTNVTSTFVPKTNV